MKSTFAVYLACLVLLVPFWTAQAQTTAGLSAQIDALLVLIADLQEQIAGLKGASPSEPPGAVISAFARNLRLGDHGEDVRNLQKALNRAADTRIASFGPGSPGLETDFFGPLTEAAVVTFQEKYAAEVLVPVGLFRGTGFVGPSTRKKLDSLMGIGISEAQESGQELSLPESSTADSLTLPTGAFISGVPSEDLEFYYVSKQNGRPGEMLTVFGTGFSGAENTIYFGSTVITDIESQTGQELSFVIPDLEPGRHALAVSNSKEMVDARYFRILNKDVGGAPIIQNVSPAQGETGAHITITGIGFSKTENLIYTTFDEIENVASPDGTTLTLTVPTIPGNKESGMGAPTAEEIKEAESSPQEEVGLFPLYIYVENNDGISNEGVFLIEFK